ncbi:MAG TPA: aldo/keto reductase [Chloroflexota bacterium]|nr:aldo/keto reductase [Chloroflexota bacterium]
MEQRTIGGRQVSALGYGAMYLSVRGRPPEEQGLAALRTALAGGVTLIDTADSYCLDDHDKGHNERLIAKALRDAGASADQVLVATKGGHTRPDGNWDVDGRPAYLRQACEASLIALGVEAIDLYQFHRPDPKIPFEESVDAVADLQREGKIRMVGLSNVSAAQIDAAQRLVEVVSVQNEFNPWQRRDESNGVLAACRERGIAYLPYSPFGGGSRAKGLGDLATVGAVAREHGATPYQVILAWLLAKSPAIIPIPCSTRIDGVRDNLGAATLTLTPEEVAKLDAMRPNA